VVFHRSALTGFLAGGRGKQTSSISFYGHWVRRIVTQQVAHGNPEFQNQVFLESPESPASAL